MKEGQEKCWNSCWREEMVSRDNLYGIDNCLYFKVIPLTIFQNFISIIISCSWGAVLFPLDYLWCKKEQASFYDNRCINWESRLTFVICNAELQDGQCLGQWAPVWTVVCFLIGVAPLLHFPQPVENSYAHMYKQIKGRKNVVHITKIH